MEKGERTRTAILERAAALASVEGLEQVTLGRLAGDVGLSKSGLFAHFRSKEQLQLAVLDAAARTFVDEVVRPALATEPGLPRLRAMCLAFLGYVERDVFPGGCLFATLAAEYGARTGPIREQVLARQVWWLSTLERLAADAVEAGHLAAGTDPRQLAFELESMLFTANHLHQLNPAYGALDRAARAIAGTLDQARPR